MGTESIARLNNTVFTLEIRYLRHASNLRIYTQKLSRRLVPGRKAGRMTADSESGT
ncbi:hypothetical protein L873DRAFT_1810046 [Choiromyces venosus 120613-1]|uniref:Uncharacterized protein n=1 Tax=Choiromyces venosus 120613-1 TaxID=1336337 RepID=A0A3N4JG33_9PEZI|nr:hypothetical protein L873DRAFT_1810046 [Choiromyces venosus 120613-1]